MDARLTPGPPGGAAPGRRELRQFAWTVGGAFLALAAAAAWRGHPGRAVLLAALGGPLVLVGVAAPMRLGPAYRAWMDLAHAISRVTTPLFLGVIYFGLLTPLGLLLRALRRRPLGPPPRAATAWVDRPPGARRGDLRRQF